MNTKPRQPDFDDFADEFEHERAVNENRLNEHDLEQALADMREGKSPKHFSADPEFQAALKLHVLTSDSEVNNDFEDQLKNRILQQTETVAEPAPVMHFSETSETEEPQSWFGKLFIPVASVAGIAVVVFAVSTVMNSTGVSTGTQDLAREASEQTIAEGQLPNQSDVENEGIEGGEENAVAAANGETTQDNTDGAESTGENIENTEESTEPTDSTDDVGIATVTTDYSQVDLLIADMESDVETMETTTARVAEYDETIDAIDAEVQALTASLSSL